MLNKSVLEALNEQIKNEYFSSYKYLAMSAYCESINMRGFASWLRKQSGEELSHAMRLFDYVLDRGGKVTLHEIDKPAAKYKSLVEMFQQVLDHEMEVTGMINSLYELASSKSDHATAVELQWFIQEQVEEEKTASDVLESLKLAGDNASALLILDSQLAERRTTE